MYMGLSENLGDNPRSPLPFFHVFFGTLSLLNIGKTMVIGSQDLTTGLGTFRQALEGRRSGLVALLGNVKGKP
jgi:hypothetical protein